MDWESRIANYDRETKFPRSLFIAADGRVVGVWIMGNDYRVRSGYYGGYPAGYLRRVRALFPDKRRVLHIFSGQVDLEALPGDTVDINPSLRPTFVDDAQTLEDVPLENYDLILADPPRPFAAAPQTADVGRRWPIAGRPLCRGQGRIAAVA
jgi:hypothetical protein